MGRPLNKKFFGSGTGNQIKVRAKIGSAAEGYGTIVKQTGTNRYKVTVGSDTGTCVIVDKSNGTLAAGEMTISVKDANNVVKQVKNVKGHTLVLDTGELVAWSFAAPAATKVQMDEEAGTLLPVITIGTQPSSATVTAPAAASFTVAATVTNGATRSYQWQVKVGAAAFTNITNGGVYSNATTATLNISNSTGLNGNQYRCVVSATGGAVSVNSNSATLTVN